MNTEKTKAAVYIQEPSQTLISKAGDPIEIVANFVYLEWVDSSLRDIKIKIASASIFFKTEKIRAWANQGRAWPQIRREREGLELETLLHALPLYIFYVKDRSKTCFAHEQNMLCPWTKHALPMNKTCFAHEQNMLCPWTKHALPMNETCFAHEQNMLCPWTKHALPMNETCFAHEQNMLCPWTKHSLPMNKTCFAHEQNMLCPWTKHALPMNKTCFAHEQNMLCPWTKHALPMNKTCFAHERNMLCPWTKHALPTHININKPHIEQNLWWISPSCIAVENTCTFRVPDISCSNVLLIVLHPRRGIDRG